MTREEAIAKLNNFAEHFYPNEEFLMAIESLTAISELSKSLKAVNRYEMDEKVLIGFNMAVAIFNKCFGEIGEMSERQTDGDLISRQSVITMLNKIENAVEDGDGFQFNEWIEYAKDIPSTEKTAEWKPLDKEKAQYYMFGYVCSKCGAPAKSPTKYCSNCGAKMHGGNPG